MPSVPSILRGLYATPFLKSVQRGGPPDDVCREWLKGAERVGISGATSTPRWLMEEVAEQLRVMS